MKKAVVLVAAFVGATSVGAPAVAAVDITFNGTFEEGTLTGTAFTGRLVYDEDASGIFPISSFPGFNVFPSTPSLFQVQFGGQTYTPTNPSAYVQNDDPFDQVAFNGSGIAGPGSMVLSFTFGQVLSDTSLPDLQQLGLFSQVALNLSSATEGSGLSRSVTFGPTPSVPEPATWALMLIGFGFVGGALRAARRRQTLAVSYT